MTNSALSTHKKALKITRLTDQGSLLREGSLVIFMCRGLTKSHGMIEFFYVNTNYNYHSVLFCHTYHARNISHSISLHLYY